jgi:hypothetical protein
MLQTILMSAYELKKIVDINVYETEEESVIGYITNVSAEHFTIKEVDKFGNSNGSTTYAVDKIKNISLDNWYLRSLQIIIDNHKKLNQDDRVTIYKKGKELTLQFKYLKENNIMTMLFFEEDRYELGFILDYDENFILFKDIEQDGSVLGITCYRINEIIGLRYNGLGEQKTKFLYDNVSDKSDFP